MKCNFESPNESEMHDHHHHGINEENDLLVTELYKCPSCHRSFNNLKSVKTHYTMYHKSSLKKRQIAGHKKHDCDKCGKSKAVLGLPR